eukprot:3628912-Pleurochrysis_carterae.AAC.1
MAVVALERNRPFHMQQVRLLLFGHDDLRFLKRTSSSTGCCVSNQVDPAELTCTACSTTSSKDFERDPSLYLVTPCDPATV